MYKTLLLIQGNMLSATIETLDIENIEQRIILNKQNCEHNYVIAGIKTHSKL